MARLSYVESEQFRKSRQPDAVSDNPFIRAIQTVLTYFNIGVNKFVFAVNTLIVSLIVFGVIQKVIPMFVSNTVAFVFVLILTAVAQVFVRRKWRAFRAGRQGIQIQA